MCTLGHLNLLCWLQEQDYDAWLVLMKYLEPIIQLRQSFPQLRRDEWFRIMLNKCYGDNYKRYLDPDGDERGDPRRLENRKPLSIFYSRYINHHHNIIGWIGDFKGNRPPNINGVIYHTQENRYCYQSSADICGSIRETRDELFQLIRDTDRVPIKKSWKKTRMLKALMSY